MTYLLSYASSNETKLQTNQNKIISKIGQKWRDCLQGKRRKKGTHWSLGHWESKISPNGYVEKEALSHMKYFIYLFNPCPFFGLISLTYPDEPKEQVHLLFWSHHYLGPWCLGIKGILCKLTIWSIIKMCRVFEVIIIFYYCVVIIIITNLLSWWDGV